MSVPGEPPINSAFRAVYNIEYTKLVSSNAKKGQDPNTFFIMFPPSCDAEHDLFVSFLEANGATVYSARTPGSWEFFTSKIDAGVILVCKHPIL